MSDPNESDDSTHSAKDGGFDNVNTKRGGGNKNKMCVSIDQKQDSSENRKYNLKVPAFSSDDPEIWFALLEGQFQIYDITEDAIKFNNVITNLDIPTARIVKDVIINPPASRRYVTIKSELMKRLCATKQEKYRQLISYNEQIGDRKPTQFLRHLRDLAGSTVPEDFLQTIWSSRLPKSTQTVLASQPTLSLNELADLADRIQEISTSGDQVVAAASTTSNVAGNASSEIAEIKKMVEVLALKFENHARNAKPDRSRPRRQAVPRSETRSTSNYRQFPVCWYHFKYGERAHRCQKPCDFKAGNAKGNQ